MSVDGSLKRKSCELEPGEVENDSPEPQLKYCKTDEAPDLTEGKPNLENASINNDNLDNNEETEDTTIEEPKPEIGNEASETETGLTTCKTEIVQETAQETAKTEIIQETVQGAVQETSKTETVIERTINTTTKTEAVILEESTDSPCISIKFHDNDVADLYKTKFLNFISTFPEFQTKTTDDLCFDVYRQHGVDGSDTASNASPKKQKRRSKVKKELFTVDPSPSPNTNGAEFRYTTKFKINTEEGVEPSSNKSKFSCFNCGEAHNLKDCPQPRDYAKINAAKQKHKALTVGRYHSEDSQKYGHLVPGKISKQLRDALGLYDYEAPHYIYLMRKLGYPPGWLEEAKIEHSNLDMFDIDGKHVKNNPKKHGLDESKIINYPGFNVPFEKGIIDDCHKYGVAPYSNAFNKKAMIDFFNKTFVKEEDNLETCDMDLDQDECQKEKEDPKVLSPLKCNSPSLVDLEQQKKQLLDELNDAPKDSDKADSGFLTVKESCFGTPLLKSGSPYATLPHPDKFSKDVSPVINFENLPNSTGKYEQLTDVLQKVRNTLRNKENA